MKGQNKISVPLTPFVLLGMVCFLVFFTLSHAVPAGRFAQVSTGMSKSQIRTLLGTPHQIRHGQPHPTSFCYGGFQRLRWCNIEVYFGENGLVTGTFHDH
jgi:hypothetical protein